MLSIQKEATPSEDTELFITVLTTIGALMLLTSLCISRMIKSGALYKRCSSAGETHTSEALIRYTEVGFIISWSLADAVAVLGIVIVAIGGTLESALPLFGASVLLLVFQYPVTEKLETIVRKNAGSTR